MIKKLIFIVLLNICLNANADDPFTNHYRSTYLQNLSSQEVLSGNQVYQRVSKNYAQKNYSKFYEIWKTCLEDARNDGTWDKYLEYHQNVLFKQADRDNHRATLRNLETQRNFKLSALCQENPTLDLCELIHNITLEDVELQESSIYLNRIICGNVALDDPFLKELYEILAVHKFYIAKLMYKDWIDEKIIHQLVPFGLAVNSTLEAFFILNFDLLEKIDKLAAKNSQHPAYKCIQVIVNHGENYLTKEYDRRFLLDIGLGRRPPRNSIEKQAGEIEKEYTIQLSQVLRPK